MDKIVTGLGRVWLSLYEHVFFWNESDEDHQYRNVPVQVMLSQQKLYRECQIEDKNN